MKATLYKELSNRQTPIELPAGKSIKESLPDIDLENAIIVVNGKVVKPDYILKENDLVTIRLTPAAVTTIAISVVAVVAVGAAIVGGVALYKAKKAAEKAQEELEKVKKLTNKSDIDNRPFLRGASNTLATGNSQPYIIGRHFFTPYLLSSPFYKITGTDGKDEYTYTVLECGFNKQVIKKLAIDDITIKSFSATSPQEGAYNIDTGIFAEDGRIEIAQDGALLTDLPALNYKVESKACNDEIPHDSDVEAGTQEYLTYTLNPYAKDVDIAITFPYGLYAMNDDGDKIETQLNITPQYSLDGGSTWRSFTFNNNGTQTTLFKRNVSTKELRFVAHKDFTLANYTTLHNNGQKAIYIRIRNNGNKDSMIRNDCYCLFYQSVCYDPDKSTSKLVPCRVVEDRERAYCTILGLKLKATKINEDKLKKINIITHGVARTWNGTAWSSTKSATRNPAAWALEIETSDSHPASKRDDSELDLDSFGEFYEHCEEQGYKFDWVITQNAKKDDVLNYILESTGAVIYTDIYGRRAVAFDHPQENALAVYNPQNIITIQNKKSFGRQTDGLRIKWVNCDDDLYQEDTYLLMREGQTLNQDSIIRDMTVTGVTTFSHIVKYARRLMAIEALRPKTTVIEVGNEGIFYTPLSKVLIQDDSLKIGLGKGFVIQDLAYLGSKLSKIYIDGKLTFEEGKQYGIIVQCYGASGATPLPLKVSGTGTTDELTVETIVSQSAEIKPEVNCIFSFGELDDNGDFTRVTTEYLISDIKRSDKGFNLELVNYNEAIYATGTIPTYQSNITQKVTEKAAEIPADYVTKRELDEVMDDLQTGNIPVGKPDAPTLVRGTANRDGIILSCTHNTDGLRNDIRNIKFVITKGDGSTVTISVSGTTGTYTFDRENDGYPESDDLAEWTVKATAVNIYGKESVESDVQPVSTDTYGTWILNQPTVTNSTSKRSVILQLSTPSGSREQYSTIQYRVQVQKQGEDNWYKPDLVSDPYADENNYKDGEGYETVANTFIQSVPMESQEAGIKTTAYNYRIVGVSVETQAESEPTIITATATASTAMDIYDSSIGVEKLAVKDLSAISGTFGDIKSDEIEKDATNFWILSKANSSLGYGRAGEFCVGTTASVEPFDLVTNPTGYKDEDEFLHYLPSKTGSTLKGLFLKLANFIVDAIGSTITGAFRVEQKASRKSLFEVDDINQKVSGIQEQRGYDNIVIGTDYDGLYDSEIIKTIADGTNLVSITGQKKLVYNTQTHTETVTDDLSVDIVKHNTEIWGLVDGVPVSGAKRKIGLKTTSSSAFEAARYRYTCAVVGSKIYIPLFDGTALEIIDTTTGQITTIVDAFEVSRYRYTCAVVGSKIYILERSGTALEIVDTTTGQVSTMANAFGVASSRYISAVVGSKIYIPQGNGTALEVIDTTTGQITTIVDAFEVSRYRYTCAVVGDKIYIPQSDGTALEIIDTTTGQITTIVDAFAESGSRLTSAVVGDKIYIPESGGATLEIIDTTTGQVSTIANAFEESRARRTCAVVGSKIYIIQDSGKTLEIIDTATGDVTTIANAFEANRVRYTSAVVGDKIYIPEYNGTALEVIDTNPHLVSITSDGANLRGISRSEYYNWTTDIATPTGISASEILAFVYDGGFTWALDLAGGQILKDTEVIATLAQSGFTSAIYSGGKFYANKDNTIREINASTGEARVLTLTEQTPHKLFVFDGKLYALPAKGATRITEIDMETFAVIKSAQKDFLQLAGNPLAISDTAYIRQRGLMTEMTGLEWGLVTSRQLVEIGGGFVTREIATDGSRRLTTAGGEGIDFDADGDIVAATAIAPLYQWKKGVGDLYRYAAGESITYYWHKLCKITTAMTFDIVVISDVNHPYRASYRLSVSTYDGGTYASYSVSLFNLGQTVKGFANLAVALDADGYIYIQTNALWICSLFVTLLYSSSSDFSITMDKLGYAPFGTASGFAPVKLITQTGAFRWRDTDGVTYYTTPTIHTDIIGNVTGYVTSDTYSTAEHRIGTWIDRKPIYRKVINFGALPNATTKTVAHGISNIGETIRLYGIVSNPTGSEVFPLPYNDSASLQYTIGLSLNYNTSILVKTGANRTNLTAIVFIEYTKTTD